MAIFDDGSGSGLPALYAGGDFATLGNTSAPSIARWDGSNWSDVGGSFEFGAVVLAVAGFDDGCGNALYVGGNFETIGGTTVNHIARWDGKQWSDLNGGMAVLDSTPEFTR